MIGTYASAVLICLSAVALGFGVCAVAGADRSPWLAAPVGFAALMIVANVAIMLPGRGWTAVAAVVILSALGLIIGRRRHGRSLPAWDWLPVVGLVVLFTALPFLTNARVGVLGISFLNDTHWHLYLAQGLLEPSIQHLDNYGVGYPLGPHAIAATAARAIGSSVDNTLTGELIAVPILTGLAALGALGGVRRPRRWLAALAAAVGYLAAADYAESAFKEPIMSLLLFGFVISLQTGREAGFARPRAVLVPLAVLTAGVLYDYSYPGLIWPLAGVVCWLALELTAGGIVRHRSAVRRGVIRALPAIGLALVLLVVLVAPDLSRLHAFFTDNGGSSVGTTGGVTAGSLANLAGPLPLLEGFNLWLFGDFRFAPPDALQAGALAGFAIVVLVFAVVRAVERRELAWVGVVAGCALVYAYTRHSQSPYVVSKALAVPGPLIMVGSGAALLRQLETERWRSLRAVAVALVTIVFFGVALESSSLALKDAQVGPTDHFRELRALRGAVHGRPTLFLVYDDYFKWELLGVPATSLVLPSVNAVTFSPRKPWTYGQAIDFDSVDAPTLDRFDYVITSRTMAQSQPPSNFHVVARSASYEVWHRVGPTPAFGVLPESGQPGAVLNCATAGGRALLRRGGHAAVRAAPIVVPVAPLVPGSVQTVPLHLPAGRWNVSLPYTSPQALQVTGSGLRTELPANLDRPGTPWPVGDVTSAGAPLTLRIRMDDPAPLHPESPQSQYFTPESLVAVPAKPDTIVSLRRACGRYVDWYQPG